MNRIIPFLGLVIACCAISACEELASADGLPYVERLVVQGTLMPGESADSIFIRRTLPLSGRYDSARALLDNVVGRVEGGGKSYPLVYAGGGRYAADGLVPESGTRYTLIAEWNGKKVQASTLIPQPPVIDTVITQYEETQQERFIASVEAVVRPHPTEIYALEIYNRSSSRFDYYPVVDMNYEDVIEQPEDTLADGKVHLIFDDYRVDWNIPQGGGGRIRAVVHAFDRPFYEFYYSYRRGNDGEIFGNPMPIRWNVEGDGIGIFIGRSTGFKNIQ